MKGTRHSEEQIIAILKQGEAGLFVGCSLYCVCRTAAYSTRTDTHLRGA
jgi:hypothetical protein